MVISISILVISLLLGFPIYMALLASGIYLLNFEMGMQSQSIVLVLYDSVAKFTLAAVPFFLLAGAILENTSLARRLVDWMFSMVGSIRGGIPLTAVLASEFFGAVSGSSAASTGTVGKILFPRIAKVESESFALGLLTSAGAIAIIMPPSITMILYGSTASISVGTLFLAGIVPALITGILLGGFIIWRSRKKTVTEKFSLPEFLSATKNAVWILLLPVVILGGIYTGFFTPTEAGAVSAVYALLVAIFIYKELGMKKLSVAVRESLILTTQIFIVIAASAVFSQALTFAQIPQQLVSLTADLPAWSFILILNLFLLLVGMFFDPTSAVLVLTPLLVPIAQHLGVDLIHLGMMMTVNLAIGMFTPPFGLNLFVSQGVFNRPMTEIIKSLTPFWVWYILLLLIVSYLPELYLWIPELVK